MTLTSCVPIACACSVDIVNSVQHVQLIGCGDQMAGVQTAPEPYKIISDQDGVLPVTRVKAVYAIGATLSSRR